ncbi:MAG: thiamine phosphate synthase [Phycisphaeraceae bacterium]|nr:thiamine phosphate synthase [Phycisphaeraceae bacterium]
MTSVYRILDANANRAREAMRVMEDAARFLLDDARLSEQVKSLRHDFATAIQPFAGMIHDRDTPGDVGTAIEGAGEFHRADVSDVTQAAGKRLSEALRSIEEYSKTLGETGQTLARAAEQLRYRGYELERRLAIALGVGQRSIQWRLCLLLTESLCRHHPWPDVAKLAIDGGVDCIQLREKTMDAGPLLQRARQLIALARPRGVAVILNDRPDIALIAQADGVHLGQTDLPCAEARKLVGPKMILGVSTSKLDEAVQARRDGADYCGVGPMFPTTTKTKNVIVGPDYLRQYVAWNGLPHLAIAGITPENVPVLAEAGARGVAVSSAICGAEQPDRVAREIVRQLPA